MKLGSLASLALIASLIGCASPAPQIEPSSESIIAASKAATGGAAWDTMDGVYEEGRHGGVDYQTRLDFRHYGMRVDTTREGQPATLGYNGVVAWRALGGHAMTQTDAPSLADRRQSAYISMNGYYFPERFPARFTYTGRHQDGGEVYDVVRTEPEGARGIDLWFDTRTHLLARMVDYAGDPAVTVTISDYRDIGGVQFAFHGVITDAHGATIDVAEVAMMRPTHVDRSIFDPPSQ